MKHTRLRLLTLYLLLLALLGTSAAPIRSAPGSVAAQPAAQTAPAANSPPRIADALAWLAARQDATGVWSAATPGLLTRDTAAAVAAFAVAGERGDAFGRGVGQLAGRVSPTTDSLARAFGALAPLGLGDDTQRAALLTRQLADGSWGATANAVQGDSFDTALALLALSSLPDPALRANPAAPIPRGLAALIAQQQADGGWALTPGAASVQASATALLALATYQGNFNLQAPIAKAVSYLHARQAASGAFGDSGGSPEETALAHLALWTARAPDPARLASARVYLAGGQQTDGSWGKSVYATALAVQALAQAQATQVTGLAADADQHTPLAGVTVALVGLDGASAATGGAGRFTLTTVPPGTRQLRLTRSGYNENTTAVKILAGQTIDLGRLTLKGDNPRTAFSYTPAQPVEGAFRSATYDPLVRFTSTSTPAAGSTIVEYLWSSSDNQSFRGTTQNYWEKIFANSGVYTVTLAVRDSLGRVGQASQTITVANTAPFVNAGPDLTTTVGALVEFNSSVTEPSPEDQNSPITTRWDFGVPGGSADAAVTVWRYNQPGSYTATFSATDKDGGARSDSRLITVLAERPPRAAFTANPPGPLNEASVTRFNDASSDPDPVGVQRWWWDFGDGTSTGLKSPPHFFADNGVFDVTLTVTDTKELPSTVTQPITVTNLPPVIAVTGSLTVPVGLAIDFANRIADPSPADDPALTVRWEFGDGTASSERNPKHAWSAPGTYTLRVSASDKDGGSRSATATVTAVAGAPVARIAGPLTFPRFQSQGYSGNPSPRDPTLTAYQWFYDGAPLSTSESASPGNASLGLHRLRLIVTNNAGLRAETEQIIRVTPAVVNQWSASPVNAAPAGNPLPQFPFLTNGVPPFTSLIDWGDGTTLVDQAFSAAARHSYQSPGRYRVVAYSASEDGFYMNPVVSSATVVPPAAPVVDFTVVAGIPGFDLEGFGTYCAQTPQEEGEACYFQSSHTTPPLSYTTDGSTFRKRIHSWGDGTPDRLETDTSHSGVYHQYFNSGVYRVTLLVETSTGLTNTVTKAVTVKNVAPTADAGLDRTVEAGAETTIEGGALDPSPLDFQALRYRWDFGDGTQANAQYRQPGFASVRHAWRQPGVYTVTLTVSDPDGGVGADTAVYTVRQNHAPVISSQPPDLAVVGQPYRYQAVASDADGDPLSYRLAQAPAGMRVSAAGLIEWTPAAGQTGFQFVNLVVADNRGDNAPHPFSVTVAAQPFTANLVPIVVDARRVSADPQQLRASGTVSVTVKNLGLIGATQPFSVTIFDDTNRDRNWTPGVDTVLGRAGVQGGLAGGEQRTISVTVDGNVLFRDNLVYAFVDSTNSVDEGARESDNVGHSGDASRYAPPPGLFAPRLELAWRGSPVHPPGGVGDWSWVTDVPAIAPLIDTNADGQIDQQDVPAIVFVAFSETDFGNTTARAATLRAIRGDTGASIFEITDPGITPGWVAGPQGPFNTGPVVGDLDGDGRPEIVVAAGFQYHQIRAYNNDGTVKWTSKSVDNTAYLGMRGAPSLADLDGDGRLEVIFGNIVWNYDGTLRWVGAAGKAQGQRLYNCCLSIVADLDLDGTPEVVVGNGAYRADGTIYWDKSRAPDTLPDGFPAVGNFDSDPFPEVVVVGQITRNSPAADGELRVFEHDGTLKWGPVLTPGPQGQKGGGPPLVADLNGDGIPDIGVAGYSNYAAFDGRDGSLLWARPIQDNSSWSTGSAAFDFDGDGKLEIVYNDELFLRVFRGSDGAVLWQTANPSGTVLEYPAIADVDGDGHAEIVAVRNDFGPTGKTVGLRGSGGIYIYGDRLNNWRPARRVWNQHSYHISNVGDDGRIPAHETPGWQRYNTYRAQVSPDGVDPFAVPDLSASRLLLDTAGCPAALDLVVRVGNGGGTFAPPGMTVAFYDGTRLIGSVPITQTLQPGDFTDLTLRWNAPPGGRHTIKAVVDDSAVATETFPEGRKDNNTHGRELTLCDPANRPPTFTSNAATTVVAGQVYRYAATASDPDGDSISFGLAAAPTGAAIEPATGQIRWQPAAEQVGSAIFEIRAADGRGGMATQRFVVNVTLPPPPDIPPLCRIPGGVPGSPEIPGNGVDDDCNPDTADTVATGSVSVRIIADKREYRSHDPVQLAVTIQRTGGDATYAGLKAIITVRDSQGSTLSSATSELGPLPPGGRTMLANTFDTGRYAPGSFTAQAELVYGTQPIAHATAPFTVLPSVAANVALSGSLDPDPKDLTTGQPLTINWTVINVGNTALDNVRLQVLAVDPGDGRTLNASEETVALGLSQTIMRTSIVTTTNFYSGTVLLVLLESSQGITRTLASSGVTVQGPDRPTTTPTITPTPAGTPTQTTTPTSPIGGDTPTPTPTTGPVANPSPTPSVQKRLFIYLPLIRR